jgi:hypothetical protein
MTKPAINLPPGISEEYREDILDVLRGWALNERVEGVILLGRAGGLPYVAPQADVVVVTGEADGAVNAAFRAACGRTWFRVRVASRRGFLEELTAGAVTPFKIALRESFRALEPVFNRDLPRAKLAAAALASAALREAEAALANASPSDAGEALARACVALAELELLNDGVRPPVICPLAARGGGEARRIYASIWRARDDAGELARVAGETSALFKRLLPAAASSVFDFLIKHGGSALAASVIEALDLDDVADIDLVLAALDAYGLVKVGREERPVPGLAGLTYNEPVLTLS